MSLLFVAIFEDFDIKKNRSLLVSMRTLVLPYLIERYHQPPWAIHTHLMIMLQTYKLLTTRTGNPTMNTNMYNTMTLSV